MSSQLSEETLAAVIDFHGHSCPGLSIGIRASELARRELGDLPDMRMVCITETDMCGVDAIQYLTGCTYGKGNLIHRDYGKMAFTFFDRESGRGFRFLLKPDVHGEAREELAQLSRKMAEKTADPEDEARYQEIRRGMQDRIMHAGLDGLFEISNPRERMPRGPRVLESLTCERCGEATMESRTRRFGGQVLCQPCFDQVEQKV
ncbi:MAG: FmdE family protein [Deltaproteobacteria bacterium]|jgi:formylmethanofuran dehydrogenase subunit E|nr:FmdE family protein [Deltaproteobacteria bacterium]